MKYYSQDGQDKFLYEEIFKDKKNGFFVEIGANDGVTLSNTKFFEDMGWEGVCVEPLPKSFEKLKLNRKCACHNKVISNLDGEVEFLKIDGYSEMLSGILNKYDTRHLERVNRELKTYGGNKEIIKIESVKFSNLITEKNIDYISIDVEGSEMDIIKSIDFNKHNIYCISVENNYGEKNIEDYLNGFGYKLIKVVGADNFFIKNG